MYQPPNSKRRTTIYGFVLIAGGVWIASEGLGSTRIGINDESLEGWGQIGIGGFLIFLGICFFAVALGYMKLKGQD